MSNRFVRLPWESYLRSGLISRRQFLKVTAALGSVVTVGAGAGTIVRPEPAAAALAAPAKQVLRYPDLEPLHFDPATMEGRPEILVGMALFDPLITFDANGNIVPLAARSWSVSTDGLTYTFHLRPGMRWSDGHPVTAADYAYSWKRVLDPTIASDYASAFYPIKGALDYNKGKVKTSDNVAVKAVDTLTLQAVLDAPAAYFPRLVSTWNYMPVPRWQVEKYGKKWVEAGNHVSNGMFMLQSWEHDKELVIVANPRYWGTKPTLQKVVFTLTDDPFRTSLPAYENNELDVTDQIQPADIMRVRNDPALSKEMHKYRWSGTAMMFCDTTNTKSPAQQPQSPAGALPRDRSPAHRERRPPRHLRFGADRSRRPGTIGYLATPPLTGGVARARELLSEAGYPDGKAFPGFTISWGKLVTFDLVAQALQQMWQRLAEHHREPPADGLEGVQRRVQLVRDAAVRRVHQPVGLGLRGPGQLGQHPVRFRPGLLPHEVAQRAVRLARPRGVRGAERGEAQERVRVGGEDPEHRAAGHPAVSPRRHHRDQAVGAGVRAAAGRRRLVRHVRRRVKILDH